MLIPRLDEFWAAEWDPASKQVRHRLDMPIENNQAILENWVWKYFLLCSIMGEYDYCAEILSGLYTYGEIIPRCRYYGPENMVFKDPGNGWVYTGANPDFQVRTDMGVGQAPCVLGLYSIRNQFSKAFDLWCTVSSNIHRRGFKMVFRFNDVVPQGNYMSLIPPFGNNITEAVCIAETLNKKIPFIHRWRAAPSLARAWNWYNIKKGKLVLSKEDPLQRSLCLYFLFKCRPYKYTKLFSKWIASRTNDVEDCRVCAESITSFQDPDWLAAQLNYALQKAIRT